MVVKLLCKNVCVFSIFNGQGHMKVKVTGYECNCIGKKVLSMCPLLCNSVYEQNPSVLKQS